MSASSAYLRLVRAPAVFSALGDPLTGSLIAGERLTPGRAARLMGAAAAMYLAGMALNDFADRGEDARERPERPIPSGDIAPHEAALLGFGLLAAGVLAAPNARRTAPLLAALIVGYDFLLKHSPVIGPTAMGACRGLSLLMGAESIAGRRGMRQGAGAAALLGTYVAGITVLARGETGADHDAEVAWGAGLAVLGLLAAAVRSKPAAAWATGVAALAGPAVLRAVRDPVPASVGPAVGAMIRAIPALDAALVAGNAPRHALVMLPLLGLARWGRKLFPIH